MSLRRKTIPVENSVVFSQLSTFTGIRFKIKN
jgi:hypothetical protein